MYYTLFLACVNGLAILHGWHRFRLTAEPAALTMVCVNMGWTLCVLCWLVMSRRVTARQVGAYVCLYGIFLCTITVPVGISMTQSSLFVRQISRATQHILEAPRCTYFGVPIDCNVLFKRLQCREEHGCIEL